jgi:hypothetical protein
VGKIATGCAAVGDGLDCSAVCKVDQLMSARVAGFALLFGYVSMYECATVLWSRLRRL